MTTTAKVVSVNKKKVAVKLSVSNSPGKILRYQYRIAVKSKVGKRKWISVSATTKKLVLKHLKKGKYTLQIRAINAAGIGPVKALKIRI